MKVYKDYEFGSFIKLLLSVFTGSEWRKYHYLRLNTDITEVNSRLDKFKLDASPLCYEDMGKADSAVFRGEKMKLYEQRFQDPNYCGYRIEENGEIIYTTWISIGNLGLPGVKRRIPLLPNEGLLEDSYCAPSARGRGLHGQMNFFRIKKLYEKGKDRVLAIVQDGNIPAMKVQQKSGFEELGVFYIGKILWISFCTLQKHKFDVM